MYLIILIVLLIGFLTLLKKNDRIAKKEFIFLLITFTIIMGLRKNVGIDYEVYKYNYDIGYYSFSLREPIWSFFNIVFKSLNLEFWALTLFIQILTSYFFIISLKKLRVTNNQLCYAIFLYVTTVGIDFLNLMRQGLAISIFFYAYSCYKNKEFNKFFIFSLFSIGIHLSIIFIFFLVLILNNTYIKKILSKIKLRYLLYMVILAYICVYFNFTGYILNMLSNLFPVYSKYGSLENSLSFSNDVFSPIVLIETIISLLIIYIAYNKNKTINDEIFFCIFSTVFNILSISTYMYDRIGILFAFNTILLISNNLDATNFKFNIRINYIRIGVLLFYISVFMLNVFFYGKVNQLTYHFYFF